MTNRPDLMSLVDELGPRFADGVDERDHTASFVAPHYDLLREHRLMSAMVPEDLGGGGIRHSAMCAFLQRLATYCSSTALALSMHQHLVAAAVYNHRNGKPGKKLLERVAANEAVLVSTGANDWLSSNGSVTKVEGGFKVSAKKPFASGAPAGDVLVTSAPYEDPAEGWQVMHFPVPLKGDGVSIADDWDTLGMRATGSNTVMLEEVFVPDEAIVMKRPRSAYHPAFNVILTVAMPLVVSAYLGAAEKAVDIAIEQASKRSGDPVTAILVGELTNLLTTAQLATESMVGITNDWDFTADHATANRVVVRKTIASNAIIATVEKALETAGGAAFYTRLGLERLLRDVHAVQYHPMQAKRQHSFTGRLALGLEPIETPSVSPLRVAA